MLAGAQKGKAAKSYQHTEHVYQNRLHRLLHAISTHDLERCLANLEVLLEMTQGTERTLPFGALSEIATQISTPHIRYLFTLLGQEDTTTAPALLEYYRMRTLQARHFLVRAALPKRSEQNDIDLGKGSDRICNLKADLLCDSLSKEVKLTSDEYLELLKWALSLPQYQVLLKLQHVPLTVATRKVLEDSAKKEASVLNCLQTAGIAFANDIQLTAEQNQSKQREALRGAIHFDYFALTNQFSDDPASRAIHQALIKFAQESNFMLLEFALHKAAKQMEIEFDEGRFNELQHVLEMSNMTLNLLVKDKPPLLKFFIDRLNDKETKALSRTNKLFRGVLEPKKDEVEKLKAVLQEDLDTLEQVNADMVERLQAPIPKSCYRGSVYQLSTISCLSIQIINLIALLIMFATNLGGIDGDDDDNETVGEANTNAPIPVFSLFMFVGSILTFLVLGCLPSAFPSCKNVLNRFGKTPLRQVKNTFYQQVSEELQQTHTKITNTIQFLADLFDKHGADTPLGGAIQDALAQLEQLRTRNEQYIASRFTTDSPVAILEALATSRQAIRTALATLPFDDYYTLFHNNPQKREEFEKYSEERSALKKPEVQINLPSGSKAKTADDELTPLLGN